MRPAAAAAVPAIPVAAAVHSVRYLQISGAVIWEQQITESSNNSVQISLCYLKRVQITLK